MPRATRVFHASERPDAAVVDTLILSHAQRQAQKSVLVGVKGTSVEFDFAHPTGLRTDDAVLLDNGSLVEIVAEPEPLVEVRAADLQSLARLAWHLGNRHVPLQIFERKLRLQRDEATEKLLQGWGVKLIAIEAPFEPEGGAYEVACHDHDHHHGHDHHHHDHGHHHGHDHSHKHDHSHAHGHKHG